MTYRQESRLILATSSLKLLRGYEIGAGPGVSDQLGHSLAPVEIRDCANHRFAFCLRARETDRIQKLFFWNINSRLHASRIMLEGLLVQGVPMTKVLVNGANLLDVGNGPIRHSMVIRRTEKGTAFSVQHLQQVATAEGGGKLL